VGSINAGPYVSPPSAPRELNTCQQGLSYRLEYCSGCNAKHGMVLGSATRPGDRTGGMSSQMHAKSDASERWWSPRIVQWLCRTVLHQWRNP